MTSQDNKPKKSEDIDVNVNLSVNGNHNIVNGKVVDAQQVRTETVYTTVVTTAKNHYTNSDGTIITMGNDTENSAGTTSETKEHVSGLGLSDLKEYYTTHGESAEATYEYLTNYIKENRDNPEILQNTANLLLNDANQMYDYSQKQDEVGKTPAETLEKMLTTKDGEEVRALICGTIHGFVMDAFHDAGVPAVLVGGKQTENHATLMYQRSDGKYVWGNYGKSMVIEAQNIKDAVREVYKKSGELESCGYISLWDNNGSYQEFALKDEAAFGNQMDKRDYNGKSPFDHSVAQKTSLDADIQAGTNGNLNAELGGTLAHQTDKKDIATTVTLGVKNTPGETSCFEQSQSVGVKVEHNTNTYKSDTKQVYFQSTTIASYTKGKTGTTEYNILTPDPKDKSKSVVDGTVNTGGNTSENVSLFTHLEAGVENKVIDKGNTALSTVIQGATTVGGTISPKDGLGAFGDARVGAKAGLKLDTQNETTAFTASISGGSVADYKEGTGKNHLGGVQFGAELQASAGVTYKPNDNVQIGGGASAFTTLTPTSKDTGVSGTVFGSYKPADSNVTVYGSVFASKQQQHLTVGGFNEQTENSSVLAATLGAQLNKKWSVEAGYTRVNDALNQTRNNNIISVGAKYTF